MMNNNNNNNKHSTWVTYIRYGDGELHPKVNDSRDVDDKVENVPYQDVLNGGSVTSPEQTENAQPGETTVTVHRRNPPRNRKKPVHLQEFETEDAVGKLQTCVDSCYRAVCDIPQTYKEAITSNRSKQWKDAMDDEVKSLEENETFSLTQLPPGKQTVGGKWVYALKSDINGSDKYKARYVAKGYSPKQGIDYEETFSPTADMTSVRIIMHQMDVKTAYLHKSISISLKGM